MKPFAIVGGAALAASLGVAAVVVSGGSAKAGDPVPLPIQALKRGEPIVLPAAALGAASSGEVAAFGPSVGEARRIRTPAGQTGSWSVIPAKTGACLVAPSNAIVCAPTESVRAGRLMAVTAPNALPKRLSEEQLKDAQDGRALRLGGSLDGATVTGLVPDGVESVVLRDGSGRALAKAPVVDNVYGVTGVDVRGIDDVELNAG